MEVFVKKTPKVLIDGNGRWFLGTEGQLNFKSLAIIASKQLMPDLPVQSLIHKTSTFLY